MSKFISISSNNRTSGNVNDYKIKLTNPIENIRRLTSMQVSIPYSWYTVMSGINDKIYIKAGVTTYTATLTEGNYSGGALGTFITEVQTQINSAYIPDNLFTVTFTVLTEKITITHASTNFTIVFGTNIIASARKLLGFNATDTSPAGLTFTGNNVYSLTGDDTIFIKSRALSGGVSYLANDRASFIIPIPVAGVFGSTIVFRAQGEEWDIHYSDQMGKTFDRIDLSVYFEDGTTLVPLNGLDWRMSFQITESVNK